MQTNDLFEMIVKPIDGGSFAVSAALSGGMRDGEWHDDHEEGKLAIDVAETEHEMLIVSTIAGAIPDRIEVYVQSDVLTIRGTRHSPLDTERDINYFYRECYWGKFSRTIVLPVHVKGESARAEYKNGMLTVRIPKQTRYQPVPIVVVDE